MKSEECAWAKTTASTSQIRVRTCLKYIIKGVLPKSGSPFYPVINWATTTALRSDPAQHASLQALQGIAVGGGCENTKAFPGCAKGLRGTVTGFSKHKVLVKWLAAGEGGLAAGEGVGETAEQEVALGFLKSFQEEPAPKKPKGGKAAVEAPAASKAVTNGIEWRPRTSVVVANAVKHCLHAFDSQLHVHKGPTHDEVLILEEPKVMIAKIALPPLTLKVFPVATDLDIIDGLQPADAKAAGKKNAKKTEPVSDIIVKAPGVADILYKRKCDELSLGQQDGSCLTVDVASFLEASASKACKYPGGCIQLESVLSGEFEFSLPTWSTSDANLKPPKKQPKMTAVFQYWTNAVEIPQGAAFFLKR